MAEPSSSGLWADVENEDDLLAEEIRKLEELPQVALSSQPWFDRARPPGSVAQKRGAICRVRCCGVQVDQKCNNLAGDGACPTILDAVKLLRVKVLSKHGSPACYEKLLAITPIASSSPSRKADALATLMAGQLRLQRARLALRDAEQLAARRRAEALEASVQLEQVCRVVTLPHMSHLLNTALTASATRGRQREAWKRRAPGSRTWSSRRSGSAGRASII